MTNTILLILFTKKTKSLYMKGKTFYLHSIFMLTIVIQIIRLALVGILNLRWSLILIKINLEDIIDYKMILIQYINQIKINKKIKNIVLRSIYQQEPQ